MLLYGGCNYCKTQDLNNVQSDIKNTNIDNPCYIVANCVVQ